MNDKTLSTQENLVIEGEELVQKTKEFLQTLACACSSLGIKLKTENEKNYAIAYERGKYVVVVPNGKGEAAKLYGNWDEALASAKKVILQIDNTNDKIVLTHYAHEH